MARKGITSLMETENWPALRLGANELPDNSDLNSDLVAALSIQSEMFQANPATSKVTHPVRFDATFDATSFPPDPDVDCPPHILAWADQWKL
jgi:hypothetical protein